MTLQIFGWAILSTGTILFLIGLWCEWLVDRERIIKRELGGDYEG